jgi:glycerol-3-phosphate dehydrogenase
MPVMMQYRTLKAVLNVEGTRLMGSQCRDLSVPYKNIGSLVVGFSKGDMKTIEDLITEEKEPCPQLEIIGRKGSSSLSLK